MENQTIPYYDNLPDFLKAVKSIEASNRCFAIFPFEQFGGPGEFIPPFRSNNYVAALVTDGKGTIHLDGIAYAVVPGTLYFLRPWTLRSICKDNQWHGFVLMFTPEFIARRSVLSDPLREHPFYQKSAQPLIHIDPSVTASLSVLFEQIQTEFLNPNILKTDRHELTYHLLQSLLIKCRYVYRQALSTTDYAQPVTLVHRFQELLQRYYLQDSPHHLPTLLTVNEAASRLRVHPHYLSDVVKKYTGKTALQHIRERTLIEAQTLLRNTELTVAEVGYKLLFEDPSNFTKFFKSLAGVTPRAYREQGEAIRMV